MRKILPILAILFLLFPAVPLTARTGVVQCGGFDLDAGGKYVEVRPLTNPVESGWGKISDSEMAKLLPPCQFCDIFKLINNIIIFFLVPSPSVNNMVAVVPLLATLLILVGGFYILIAAGRPNLQSQGKTIITAVVIGLLVVYIAWIVVNSILTFLGVAEWTGLLSWWDIKCD